ncbi:MAG: hypothetical protein ACNFW9_00315 [Candidatus Kerfeldbacteria bacterium]|jgi:hypothetical protein
MRKHGTNCECGMCKVGKAMGMIKKPENSKEHNHDHSDNHEYDENHSHEAK